MLDAHVVGDPPEVERGERPAAPFEDRRDGPHIDARLPRVQGKDVDCRQKFVDGDAKLRFRPPRDAVKKLGLGHDGETDAIRLASL